MKTIIITPEIEAAVSRLHSDDEIAAFFLALMHRTDSDEDKAQDKQQSKRKRGGQPGNSNACRKTNGKTNKTNEEKESEKETEKETEKEKKQKNKEKEKDKEKGKEKEGRTDKTATRFVPPQLEDIQSFVLEKNYQIDPEVFYYYYEANGWRVGRAPMKNWRAAVAQWNAREKNQNRQYANHHRNTATGARPNRRPTVAELTAQSAAQAIANLQQRREQPLADVLGW